MLCEIDKRTYKSVSDLTIYCLLKLNIGVAIDSNIIGAFITYNRLYFVTHVNELIKYIKRI